ncbi:hypothetical protein L2K70_17110 [Nocardioides KLBMP 9356]|uniref:Uncharacterized protein n=1 Tax=Nocardioides potassii TaxID=2911371 RepID=A0ABS9HFV8_9ACTN|nr:hypothetical protein [Nocardioides potassii]MCF6379334.1 hypothetical protein [Nocardioides potassii]
MLPGQPPTFRPPSAAERPWWWRLEDADGAEVVLPQHSEQRFGTQGDAESWVGEVWPDLAEQGVAAVTLFEHERLVYGPMSLSA